MRIRTFTCVIAVMVSTLAAVAPASAGSAEDPDISDDCGAQVRTTDHSLTVVPGHVDVCAGWFGTTAKGLQVTLQMSGPTSPEPGFWAVWWDHGECTYEVFVDDSVTAEHAQGFAVGCGERPTGDCPVPNVSVGCESEDHFRRFALPDSSVVRQGNTLAVSVDFTGHLSEFVGAHAAGQVLRAPRAYSSTVVGPVYAHTAGCHFGDDGTYCFEANGDFTFDGRDYIVGT